MHLNALTWVLLPTLVFLTSCKLEATAIDAPPIDMKTPSELAMTNDDYFNYINALPGSLSQIVEDESEVLDIMRFILGFKDVMTKRSTPLSLAAFMNNERYVRIFLQLNESPEIPDIHGNTALSCAHKPFNKEGFRPEQLATNKRIIELLIKSLGCEYKLPANIFD